MMGWLILIAATGGGGLIGHAAFGAEGGVALGWPQPLPRRFSGGSCAACC